MALNRGHQMGLYLRDEGIRHPSELCWKRGEKAEGPFVLLLAGEAEDGAGADGVGSVEGAGGAGEVRAQARRAVARSGLGASSWAEVCKHRRGRTAAEEAVRAQLVREGGRAGLDPPRGELRGEGRRGRGQAEGRCGRRGRGVGCVSGGA